MKIEKIIKMKNNKYKIILNGEELLTYDNVILDNDILYKKEIDNDLYKKILNDTLYYDIYNKAVKYILKKMRSEKEVTSYLNKFNITSGSINSIIKKLKEINLINDIEYCKAFINDKITLSNDGINKIKNSLINQNIPIDIIDNELKKIDKDLLHYKLEKLIIKKIRSNKKSSNNMLKQKLTIELSSLGYNREDIFDIINKNLQNDSDVLNTEFNKLYIKLSKKYEGNELDIKLKQKLIQKGFKLNDINNLLEKK